ncbi:hypothetical protein AU387_03430 [Bacillus halotolerans]|uniref:YvaD family protein n=1 Tax=Bacillus halotolerans TaxID=260554 RepID=UPI00075124FE|nr:YvaD family protein [Bacillus halotolerans]KUP36062.1 hypothetical protein AU387_03430 [Bacillus halotolerans]
MRVMKLFFLVTDVGFILYWLSAGFSLMPESWAFKHYQDPFMIAWNWSFFPLDILISITGLYSLYLQRIKRAIWRQMAQISLVLTFCSGLQALSFWTFSGDFDLAWWLFNGYLLIYPLFFIHRLLSKQCE